MTKNAFSIFDMMLNMQRMSVQAATAYHPLAAAFRMPAINAESPARGLPPAPRASYEANEEQVIGLGEEVLSVATRMVPGKTTRLRRVTVETPVQQDITLHTETVVLERRQPAAGSNNEILTEVTIEMSDFNEVPVVSKTAHLVEEVLLRKEITARTETIRDTLRRDTLEVDQPSNLPVVFQAATKEVVEERDESHGDDNQSRKPFNNAPRNGGKARPKRF
jgi:uncharacterized protein (TIGR02271 family)